MTGVSDGKLLELIDHHEIHQVLMRYCRGTDRIDEELISSVFYPDAIIDHGIFSLSGVEVAAEICERDRRSNASQHLIANEFIELAGDVAYCESYLLSFNRSPHEGKEFTFLRVGRFIDRFERRGGEWRIAHRILLSEVSRFDELHDAAPPWRVEVSDRRYQSLRSREDPAYQALHDRVGASSRPDRD